MFELNSIVNGLAVNLVWVVLAFIVSRVARRFLKSIRFISSSYRKAKKAANICGICAIVIYLAGFGFILITKFSDVVKALLGFGVFVVGLFLFSFHQAFEHHPRHPL